MEGNSNNIVAYFDPIDNDYEFNNLFIIYVTENKEDKSALTERLIEDAYRKNLDLVRLNVAKENFNYISGDIKFRIIIKYHPPLWWKNTPFLLLVENINALSPKSKYDIRKLSLLINYTRSKNYSPIDSLDRTLPEGSISRAVILQSEHNHCLEIFKAFENPQLLYSIRVFKVYKDDIGRWHKK
ncbi:MAG: hypothetical protein N3A59_08315 [Thermodesulfovibrionales bacterium]|nr:hypothetical protein [Thermodesulfovibrionales bacterium]